jgi:hypothetical protein
MKISNFITATAALAGMLLSVLSNASIGPIRVGEDGHTFVDQNGEPWFWIGDTQWELFRGRTFDDAMMCIRKRKEQGFTSVQMMLTGIEVPWWATNVNGDYVWINEDPLQPNEAYFTHIDSIIKAADELDMIMIPGIYCTGFYLEKINMNTARAWARYVSGRYKDYPNIIWSMYPRPDIDPALIRELGEGLQEGDSAKHLVTFLPEPAQGVSSSYLHNEPWLGANMHQTWSRVDMIYPLMKHDYDLQPPKPAINPEAAHENGWEYGFDITDLVIRNQAYYCYLAGGHYSYGETYNWRCDHGKSCAENRQAWIDNFDAPGAGQMTVLREFFESIEWWKLVPDQSVLVSGGQTDGSKLNLAARSSDNDWIIAYLGGPAEVSIAMDKIELEVGGKIEASWIDPRTGDRDRIGEYENNGARAFARPSGWSDALLFLAAPNSGPATAALPTMISSRRPKGAGDPGRMFTVNGVCISTGRPARYSQPPSLYLTRNSGRVSVRIFGGM